METARLVKYNDPHIEVDWTQQNYGNFHQLSDEEFERYNALGGITHDYSELIKEGYQVPTYPADIVELAREWKAELYEKTWGPKLTILAGTVYNRDVTSEDDEKLSQLLEDKYQELSPPSREFVVNYDVVDQLLIELKSELERR